MSMVSQIRRALHTMFGQCAAQANEQHCVIQRVRKFDPKSFAETFILAFLQNPNASSAEIASMAATCDVPMSVQAIDKRFTHVAADFFQTVFTLSTKLVVHAEQSLAPILDRFTAVHVIDGSSISLPDSQEKVYKGRGGSHESGKSALKLQTEIDLKTGALECVDITQGCDADVACARQSVLRQKGALRITDLGYFRIAVFIAIANMNAYFLSRIQRTTLVHFAGKSIGNVVDFLCHRNENVIDCWIEIGSQDRLACRLIGWRVPGPQAAERRRKLRLLQKKRGRGEPSQEALKACDWMFLVTNVPEEKLSFKEAIVLYRARWQIELLFKRWKSIGLIATLTGKNDAAIMVRLWARLCASVIQHWLTVFCGWRPDLLISFARVAKSIRIIVSQIAMALSKDGSAALLERILQRFYETVAVSARADKRTKRGTVELLRNPEKLDYILS